MNNYRRKEDPDSKRYTSFLSLCYRSFYLFSATFQKKGDMITS